MKVVKKVNNKIVEVFSNEQRVIKPKKQSKQKRKKLSKFKKCQIAVAKIANVKEKEVTGWEKAADLLGITYKNIKHAKQSVSQYLLRQKGKTTHKNNTSKKISKGLLFVQTDDFLRTYEWRRARYIALKNSNGKCQLCGRSSHDGIILNVDHIKPRKKHPELALTQSNLQVLCNECNHGKGNSDDTDWRKCADYETDWRSKEHDPGYMSNEREWAGLLVVKQCQSTP